MNKYTFIICTYNRERFIGETIASILGCCPISFNLELLIIDNNSRDATPEIVKRFLGDSRVKYFVEKKQGLSNVIFYS